MRDYQEIGVVNLSDDTGPVPKRPKNRKTGPNRRFGSGLVIWLSEGKVYDFGSVLQNARFGSVLEELKDEEPGTEPAFCRFLTFCACFLPLLSAVSACHPTCCLGCCACHTPTCCLYFVFSVPPLSPLYFVFSPFLSPFLTFPFSFFSEFSPHWLTLSLPRPLSATPASIKPSPPLRPALSLNRLRNRSRNQIRVWDSRRVLVVFSLHLDFKAAPRPHLILLLVFNPSSPPICAGSRSFDIRFHFSRSIFSSIKMRSPLSSFRIFFFLDGSAR